MKHLWLVLLPVLACAQVKFQQHPERISVEIDGKPYTELIYGPGVRRPFLHPLRSATGQAVTRPLTPTAGESTDHPHHQGLSFTYADVNGYNFWASDATQLDEKSGSIRLNRVVKAEGGAKSGTAEILFDWLDPKGHNILTEDRVMAFYSDPEKRTIDFSFSLRAEERIVFGDTKEGMFNIRLSAAFKEPRGLMTSSSHCRGEAECWGKRAQWMDFAANVNGEATGVAIFDHPDNPVHPTYWHARGYGLFAANPFGVRDFTGDKSANGSLTLEKGKSLQFRYRVLIHPGKTEMRDLGKAYSDYAGGADVILRNGRIVTADAGSSIASAVALRGGRIETVGDDAEVMREKGARTKVIDLQGRMVLPGLIDSHVHPLMAGLSEFRQPLPPLHSYEDVRKYIRAEARRIPKGEWIVVPRTFPTRLKELRMPTRELLDVESEHPVLFDASYVWIVNTAGLRKIGVDRNTPNPPGGEIVKDEQGEPNGILRNAEVLLNGLKTTPDYSHAEKLEALRKMLARYPEIGLTTVGDRAVTDEEVGLYRELRDSGNLPVRAVLTWRLNASAPADELVKTIRAKDWVTNLGGERLKFGSFKVTLDGGMTIGTAWQREPYGPFAEQLYGLKDRTDRGQLFVPPDKLLTIMRAARDKGWQMTAHSQGGGAVDVLLDTFEKLNAEKPLSPTRSHWMHASFQTPAAIARAKKIGMLADVQPAWLYFDGPALKQVFGQEGMRWFFPLRSYIDAGIIVAGGSDHMIGFDPDNSVNSYNPFLAMWIAVTRKTIAGEVLYPEQRITREEALRMYTTNAAYLQFNERDRGSIEPGKLADLVVIDRDYLNCPEAEIRKIRPVMTFLNGQMVYQAKLTKSRNADSR